MPNQIKDQELDRLLKEVARAEPPAALYGRVLEAMNGPRPFGWRDALQALWPFGPAWQPATAFVLMALMGFLLSPTLNPTASEQETYELADASFATLILGDEDFYGAYP